jgi:hypothetical protein
MLLQRHSAPGEAMLGTPPKHHCAFSSLCHTLFYQDCVNVDDAILRFALGPDPRTPESVLMMTRKGFRNFPTPICFAKSVSVRCAASLTSQCSLRLLTPLNKHVE